MHSVRRTSRRGSRVIALTGLSLTLLAAACGSQGPSQSAQPAQSTATGSAPAGGGARVFFIQPKEGDTVKSPVHFEFGSDQITISPVPQGTVDKPRPGMVHHHLGVDTDCLPAGEVIPKASPWVHFGDGKTVIEMQLSPGPHKFALQAGDDQHRTLPGLCQVMNVTVAQ